MDWTLDFGLDFGIFIFFKFFVRFFIVLFVSTIQCQDREATLLPIIKNTIILFICRPKIILLKHCFYFLLDVKMIPRETGNNGYAKFWVDKQRVLWYF